MMQIHHRPYSPEIPHHTVSYNMGPKPSTGTPRMRFFSQDSGKKNDKVHGAKPVKSEEMEDSGCSSGSSTRNSESAKGSSSTFSSDYTVKSNAAESPMDSYLNDSDDNQVFCQQSEISAQVKVPTHRQRHLTVNCNVEEFSFPPTPGSVTPTVLHSASTSGTGILDRIRSLSISTSNPSKNKLSEKSYSSGNTKELDPLKLPKDTNASRIKFTHKCLRDANNKWSKICQSNIISRPGSLSSSRKPGSSLDSSLKFGSPCTDKERIERKISGQLDTSTPTGAAITAMNFGVRKISESDHYLLISKSPMRSPSEFLEDGVERLADEQIFHTFLNSATCYDIMPDSGKLVCLDSTLAISKAVEALDDHVIGAAPVWDGKKQQYTALFLEEDLIQVLILAFQMITAAANQNYTSETIEQLGKQSVSRCLSVDGFKQKFISTSPEVTLFESFKTLHLNQSRVMLVQDAVLSGNPLFLLNDSRIITFLYLHSRSMPTADYMLNPLQSTTLIDGSAQISMYNGSHWAHYTNTGTRFNNDMAVSLNTPLIDLLHCMACNRHHNALVSKSSYEFVFHDLITASDITNLVRLGHHKNFNLTVGSILGYRTSMTSYIICCNQTNSMEYVMGLFAKEKAKFAVVWSGNAPKRVIGVLSIMDILNYVFFQCPTSNEGRRGSIVPPLVSSPPSIPRRKTATTRRSVSFSEDVNRNRYYDSFDETEEDDLFNLEME